MLKQLITSNHLSYQSIINPFKYHYFTHISSKEPLFKDISIIKQRHKYLPLIKDPLIPGMPRIIPINQDILNSIEKSNTNKIIFSTLKGKLNQFDLFHISLNPKIKSLKEVNEIGCLCNVTIKPSPLPILTQDPQNKTKNKNTLLINPISLCKITQLLKPVNPIGQVEALIYKEKKLFIEELNPELSAKYNYLKEILMKSYEIINDDNVKGYLISLKDNYNLRCLNDLIYLALASLNFPSLFLQYSFLIKNSNKIQSLLSIIDINKRLDAIINELSSLYSELVTWESLVSQYNFHRDQTKTNEKIKAIYMNLKTMFDKNKDERQSQIDIYNKNLEGKEVPEHINKIIKEEMKRYMVNDKYSMESNVIRNYLDILTSLPYGISTEENLNIEKAKDVLNETHYGMEKVKERILESIAVGNLKGKIQGKILCFVGPPGVGKTSIGESIAQSINRKYFRISLGGDRETNAIKGFRRTYVGAIPGKIVKALKTTCTENPVILLDEIDKLSVRSIHGDPSSVLLEVLDPEQNHSFTDDYLDTHIDLSKVMFICTANSIKNIPQPLYDRMEIIEVSGYTFSEKKFIYEKYLKPKAIKKAGLDNDDNSYVIDDDVIDCIINDYCRESGVRSLQRAANRIFEKIALKKVTQEHGSSIHITANNLKDYLGPATFSSMRMYDGILPKGVAIGLGFNNYGGSVLYIESSNANHWLSDSKSSSNKRQSYSSSYFVTGNVGKVMDESTKIAMTYAKNFIGNLEILNKDYSRRLIDNNYFNNHSIHLHFPSGAIPKDGPSAGVTICTSLISLALNTPIISNLAMTGELSLTGKVLKIGGVKEKIMAAKREGMKKLIFPYDNKDDINELEANIKEGLLFYFVKNYSEIFSLCFPDIILSTLQVKH